MDFDGGIVWLDYWHKTVSVKKQAMSIQLSESAPIIKFNQPKDDIAFKGWYVSYPEGYFFLFKRDRQIYCGTKQKVICLANKKSKYSSSFSGNELLILSNQNDEVLKFKYNTYLKYIFNPLNIVEDIFMPDTEADLVTDLPSFVHSWLNSGDLENKIDQISMRNISV